MEIVGMEEENVERGGASVLFEKGKEGLRLCKRRRRGMLI